MDAMKCELRRVEFDHPALQTTMPIIVEHSGEFKGLGSASFVAPGLALTASHVVNPERWSEYSSANNVSVCAFQVFEGQLYRWDVDAIYGSRALDIAFLRFRKPDFWGTGSGQINFPFPRLNFNPPRVGDEIRMFGFPGSELKESVLRTYPSECVAMVKAVDAHPENPDIPFWYAQLEGQLEGGMSGGPCFDKDWNLVGVNGCGWSFKYEAYMALLWPAMKLEIDLFKTGAFPAIDLFKEKPARALGYRRLRLDSVGEVHLAAVDPDDLIPTWLTGIGDQAESMLNFAAANAQNALGEARVLIDQCMTGEQSVNANINGVYRALQYFFWELESALSNALSLAAIQAGIELDRPFDWDGLLAKWREKDLPNESRPQIGFLGF